MEKTMVFDDRTKKRLGYMCFTPATCFFICFVYFMVLVLSRLAGGHHQIYAIEGLISSHYDILFAMIATSAIITAPIFIYCLVILARVKNMNSQTKMQWILLLSVMAPIASMLFWLRIIRKEPKEVGVYPSIA